MDQKNGQYTGSRERWPRDRRGESHRSMYDDSGLCKMGCVKAVFWTGSAALSRATEVNERIDLRRTLQCERRD